MSEPELIAGKWVERRVYVGGTNACGRCAFDPSKCRSTYHDGRTVRAHCDVITGEQQGDTTHGNNPS